MNVLMFTNTYLPHVGGVARSVDAFAREFRRQGHAVLIVAPEFDDAAEDEEDVIRFPALQRFNGSDFSIPLPLPGLLWERLEAFQPQVVHSHHPFLLGYTAVRTAARWDLPIVFTHHTRYEEYTHYVPGDSPRMRRFVIDLATGYCNLCDAVIAPSESIAQLLRNRGVEVPIEPIPTGVELDHFTQGDGDRLRRQAGIDPDAFVVGHVGRLAPEKNLEFLADAVTTFLRTDQRAVFLLVGEGPSKPELKRRFARRGLSDRLFELGVLSGSALADAYAAMNVFAFASQSETQGMVLTEAMAASAPAVAVDAPGAREVVVDGDNGRLLGTMNVQSFAAALAWVAGLSPAAYAELRQSAFRTAERFSMPRCAARTLELYESLIAAGGSARPVEQSLWASASRWIEDEWKLLVNVASAASEALSGPAEPEDEATR